MRIWIAGGGTGGHVYPGLSVAQTLRAEDNPEIIYIGSVGGVEEQLVERAGLRFAGVPAGGVHSVGLWRSLRNIIKLIQGWKAAYRLGKRERPVALFVTGGYASVPVALAAWTLRVPILVYLPDIEPGLAVRFISRLATRIAVTVENSRAYFPTHKVVVTGYPVRPTFHEVELDKAQKTLGLSADEPVLLVMGGSRGARSINQALISVLEEMLELTQVVHISGSLDWPWVAEQREALSDEKKARYHAFPYLHGMGKALVAADLVVCRAGASTLGELPFFELPGVLVPYPHAWRYQRINAQWLTEQGAAITLDDESIAQTLLPTVRELLADHRLLAQMGKRARKLARPGAAKRLAAELRMMNDE